MKPCPLCSKGDVTEEEIAFLVTKVTDQIVKKLFSEKNEGGERLVLRLLDGTEVRSWDRYSVEDVIDQQLESALQGDRHDRSL